MTSFYSKLVVAAALTLSASLANAQEMLVKVPASHISKSTSTSKKGNSHTKAVKASLTSNTQYVAGTTSDINFRLYLSNTDYEYGDSLAITFPAGFTPNGSVFNPIVTPASPIAQAEALNGVNGQTISWGDNDNTFGGIETGTVIEFTVNVTIAPGISGDKTGNFFVSGDQYAAFDPAADYSGTFKLSDSAPKANLEAYVYNPYPWFYTPYKHAATPLYGAASNSNADLTENVNFTISATPGVFTETNSLMNPFPADTFEYVFTTAWFTPTAAGKYTFSANCTFANDYDNADNTASVEANLTNDYFCYTDYDTANCGALGIGGKGFFGSYYSLASPDQISKVVAYFKSPALGTSVSASVYGFDRVNSELTSFFGSSAEYMFTDTNPQERTFAISKSLPAGEYLIVIEETADGGYCGLGSTPDNFVAGNHFAFFNDTLYDLNSFPAQYRQTFMVKPYFSNASGVSESAVEMNNIMVSPNPGSGIFNISGIENAEVNVLDNLGRIVLSTKITPANTKVDITSLPAGNYNLQFVNSSGTTIKKVVLVK